ncbi:MAG TPA: hypothetical protein VFD56_04100 [Chitinophagaceae bacterium]|nr:hypothetical protein [Chitinophagaceae bacterium]
MEKKRKIEKVVRKGSFAEDEDEELIYWANLSVKERMSEAAEWNRKVWQHILKDKYPERIEKTGGKKDKSLTDEDDF